MTTGAALVPSGGRLFSISTVAYCRTTSFISSDDEQNKAIYCRRGCHQRLNGAIIEL
jgi:hypothetical protein